MRDKEWSPDNVIDAFSDSIARGILVLAGESAISAEELADELDVAPSTIYRRTNRLVEFDLLAERPHVDENGNQYKVFETTFKRISFEVGPDGYVVDLQMRRKLTGQFEAFWTDLERSSSESEVDVVDSLRSNDSLRPGDSLRPDDSAGDPS